MYHSWYEQYTVAGQLQRDLYRQADEARLVDTGRKSRKEEKKHVRQARLAAAANVANARATLVLRRK